MANSTAAAKMPQTGSSISAVPPFLSRRRDDVFHMLEQELDWAELAALPPGRDEIVES
jgi:hypothetical protein